MSLLQETIRGSFDDILSTEGVKIQVIKAGTEFYALISSGEFMADFTWADQDVGESLQGVTWKENCPKTGDLLLIDEKKYIVNSTQKRSGSPISRFYCNLTKKKH